MNNKIALVFSFINQKKIIYTIVIPLGFFEQSPFDGSFPSAHKHLCFLSLGSFPQDVFGVSRQSESVLHSRIPLLPENIQI